MELQAESEQAVYRPSEDQKQTEPTGKERSRTSPFDQVEAGSQAGCQYSGKMPLTDLKTVAPQDIAAEHLCARSALNRGNATQF
jgi:hypothetical protein